ncbi:MAG: SDR family oxidoreductase [Deltaproteobacteria bacterium]|nr:MAG: SDR family oxidoreductase [Deltaproteobacteria bacterium]
MSGSRVALVTGGAGGLGSAIARTLASAGRRVVVADLERAAAERVAAEISGLAVALDVTRPESVSEAVARARDALGPIEICVNCAGWDEFRPFLETDDALTAKLIEINLVGPIRVSRAVLGDMSERRFGRIVNIASDAGRVGSSLEAVYSGAKGGLIAFTKTIAREFARFAITANAVCPGPADTPLLAGMIEKSDAGRRVIDAVERSTPLRRLGRPEDVAPAVAFLASEEAGFITGQTLSVSGGLTMA